MAKSRHLPTSPFYTSDETYVHDLLHFVTTSRLHRTLCGGVHLLDFFIREPDVYNAVLPASWRAFFAAHDEMMDVLNLLMRDDVPDATAADQDSGTRPPEDLLEYIRKVRRLSLDRSFSRQDRLPRLTREVALGMKVKKVEEVAPFAQYIDSLCHSIEQDEFATSISHIIDLGSGQGYLTRALASAPYHRRLVGVESRENNIAGSRNWDMMAGLTAKSAAKVNKKRWKEEQLKVDACGNLLPKPDSSPRGQRGFFFHPGEPLSDTSTEQQVQVSSLGKGSVQYVSHYLHNGDLSQVINEIVSPSALSAAVAAAPSTEDGKPLPLTQDELNGLRKASSDNTDALVISLHSCGNLLHHGLRSMLLTPSVKAVAMVGCCYNLLTERLGPPTHKIPSFRSRNARVEELQRAADPHGFPMSQRLCDYSWTPSSQDNTFLVAGDPATHSQEEVGIRLNITARMMAVQAPLNWGREDSKAFFERHFYRAVLQRIFFDLDLVPAPPPAEFFPSSAETPGNNGDGDAQTTAQDTAPVILGSLPKPAYASFVAYVRAAAAKLARHATHPSFPTSKGSRFAAALEGLSDEQIRDYEERYGPRRRELATMWSLMAFSAQVLESLIVVDRWLWLREQDVVDKAWVETVFDYGVSPRNLVVVGIKKKPDSS